MALTGGPPINKIGVDKYQMNSNQPSKPKGVMIDKTTGGAYADTKEVIADELERIRGEQPDDGPRFAKRIGSTSEHGRSQTKLLCACGKKSGHYLWSWAGHGKTRCPFCQMWICYRTLQVFHNPDELAWRQKVIEAGA